MSELIVYKCAYVCDPCSDYVALYAHGKEIFPETIPCESCGGDRVLIPADEKYFLGKRVITA